MAAIAVLTVLSLGLFVAMIALSLWLADKLEERTRREQTAFTQAIIDEVRK